MVVAYTPTRRVIKTEKTKSSLDIHAPACVRASDTHIKGTPCQGSTILLCSRKDMGFVSSYMHGCKVGTFGF